MRGRLIVLNGSSSSGKSSLARALQRELARRGEAWVVFGWDDFVPRLPARWHAGPLDAGDRAAEGIAYRVVADDDDGLVAVLEPGAVARRMLAAYHRAVAAVAAEGIDVIVDEVLMTAGEWDHWQQVLDGFDARWVAVRCPTEVVVERERRRGDRYLGLARGTAERVHRHPRYDVEVDTTTGPPERLAKALLDALG